MLWTRQVLRLGSAIFAVILSSVSAYAMSARVLEACKPDYYQHCSNFSVGTEELRQCMRQVGENLSTPCLVALVEDGEITKAEVEAYKARHGETDGAPPPKDSVAISNPSAKSKKLDAVKKLTSKAKKEKSSVAANLKSVGDHESDKKSKSASASLTGGKTTKAAKARIEASADDDDSKPVSKSNAKYDWYSDWYGTGNANATSNDDDEPSKDEKKSKKSKSALASPTTKSKKTKKIPPPG